MPESDTLHINNRATSLSFEGKAEPVSTDVYMSGRTSGQLYFEDQFGSYIETGKFQEIEKIVASGTGNLQFFGFNSPGAGTDVTGTAHDDLFFSFGADDTMRGGAGNDRFSAIGGHDTIVSGSGDADQFFFSPDYFYLKSAVDITGFNGAGTVGRRPAPVPDEPRRRGYAQGLHQRRHDDLRHDDSGGHQHPCHRRCGRAGGRRRLLLRLTPGTLNTQRSAKNRSIVAAAVPICDLRTAAARSISPARAASSMARWSSWDMCSRPFAAR